MSKGKYDKLRRGLMANPIPVTRRLPGQPRPPITEPVQDQLPLNVVESVSFAAPEAKAAVLKAKTSGMFPGELVMIKGTTPKLVDAPYTGVEVRVAQFLAEEADIVVTAVPMDTMPEKLLSNTDRGLKGLAKGLMLKEEGQTKALTGAASWAERANTWIVKLPAGRVFSANELVREVGLPHPDTDTPNRNNAVGAIFSSASRRGLMHKTGNYKPSNNSANRGAVVAIWVRTSKETW